MKEIKLTRGMVALVDDADFDWLNQWKWYVQTGVSTFYAVRMQSVRKCETESMYTRKQIWMHREIMKIKNDNILIDHKDHNGLNNQKINLRFATKSQNNSNKKALLNGTSKYLGVSLEKQTLKWKAQIKGRNLGRFKTEEEAALIYNKKATELYGEFANLNIIP